MEWMMLMEMMKMMKRKEEEGQVRVFIKCTVTGLTPHMATKAQFD
jgi:hypothetical protein